MASHDLKDNVYEVLNVNIRDQIMRIEKSVDTGPPIGPNKRKRPFDDITNTTVIALEPSSGGDTAVSLKATTKLEDATVLNEIDHVLKHTHILKRWYLGILQQKQVVSKKDGQGDYLLCKVVKKGVSDAEDHAFKMLNHIQDYHLKRLELSSQSYSSPEDKIGALYAEQKKMTLRITDMIYAIKTTHMMRDIINIYAEFLTIAIKLYESNK